MTDEIIISDGAVSCGETNWYATDWQKINLTVKRLQARIVKALQENRWGKVKALQRLLTRSYSAKALAVRKGCDFNHITDETLVFNTDKLNNRPRKSLSYATPNEIFNNTFVASCIN